MQEPGASKPPLWFVSLSVVALLWNLAGAFAVVADLMMTPAQVSALPAEQQALCAQRSLWSIIASLVAVGGGTLGCIALLLRRRWALVLFYASLAGLVLQDIGIFVVSRSVGQVGVAPLVLQSLVLAIAIGLIFMARLGARKAWLRS